MLSVQQAAPAFTTLDQNNNTVRLADFTDNKNVVLYFYPKDDTPGCTIEANQFTQYIDEFSAHDTVVYGVSKDTCDSHLDFIKKFNLKVGLLVDASGVLCEAYGVWQEKEKNGIKKMGIVRSTFIIDKSGIIRFAEYGVDPEDHALAILEKIKAI
ncbi:MAG: peroxiredoxin [Gammaproteobacteria bacterium]|nr:peroxiredoxin [Gammaproteobacteria bacterium]